MTNVENYKNPLNIIYEAIGENYFKEGKNFTDEFLQMCRNNTNEPQRIPHNLKNKVKINDTKNRFYNKLCLYDARLWNNKDKIFKRKTRVLF